MSGAGRHAVTSVSSGVTANTGPGIMAIQASGHISVSLCRMLAQEPTIKILYREKEPAQVTFTKI